MARDLMNINKNDAFKYYTNARNLSIILNHYSLINLKETNINKYFKLISQRDQIIDECNLSLCKLYI